MSFVDYIRNATQTLPRMERLPDFTRMHSPSPYHFLYHGKWPSAVRRRRLVTVSSQTLSFRGVSFLLSLFSLEGTGVFVETIREGQDEALMVCRAYHASGAVDRHADLAQYWDAVPAPFAGLEGASPYIATSSPSPRPSSAASTHSCGSAAFDVSYAALTYEHLGRQEAEYRVCVETAWSKWPELLDCDRRRAVIDVIDDLMSFFGASVATTHAAVSLMDRFLFHVDSTLFKPSKRALRYVVCVVVLIASKNGDTTWPSVPELCDVVKQWERERPQPEVLAEMELLVLDTVKYLLHPPTLREYVSMLLSGEEFTVDHILYRTSMWVADACLRHTPSSKQPLAALSAAVVLVAARESGTFVDDDRFLAKANVNSDTAASAWNDVLQAIELIEKNSSTPLGRRFSMLQ